MPQNLRLERVVGFVRMGAKRASEQASEEFKGNPPGVKDIPGVDKLHVYEVLMQPENAERLADLKSRHGEAAWAAFEADAKRAQKARGLI